MAIKSQEDLLFAYPHWDFGHMQSFSSFYVGAGNPYSVPHTCTVSTLPTEPLPQPQRPEDSLHTEAEEESMPTNQ